MNDNRLRKVKITKIKDDFILTCPKCNYSFRPVADPKNKRNKRDRCPMCGFKWNLPNLVNNNPDSLPKKL